MPSLQDHHLEPPSPLPGRTGPATLGHLHHLERRPTGPPPLPQPDAGGSGQGAARPPGPIPPPAPTALSPRLTSEADLQVLPRWSRSVTWTRKRSRRASTATRIPRCVARSGDLVPKGGHPQDAILGPGCDAAQDLPPGKATGATCLPAPESGTIRDAKVAGWGDRCRIQPRAAVTGPRASAAGVRVARPP